MFSSTGAFAFLENPMTSEQRTCRTCDAPLEKKPGPGRWPAFCDVCRPRVRAAQSREWNLQRPPAPPIVLSCSRCSAPFIRGQRRAKYCSTKCRVAASNERRKSNGKYAIDKQRRRARYQPTSYTLTCAHCDAVFAAKRKDTQYCSPACLRRGNQRRCSVQGCDRVHLARGFCSTHYNNTYFPERHKRWPEDPAKKAKRDLIRAKRRRASYRGVESEDVDRELLGERDRWVCGICLRKVDKALAYPHPKSQSLDHVIPLAEGGPHTYANTRIAHLACNSLRRDRGGNEQLALIG